MPPSGAPRKRRLQPAEWLNHIAKKMSYGARVGNRPVQVAAPARKFPDARIIQRTGTGCPCPLPMRVCTPSGGGPFFDQSGWQVRTDFVDFDDYDAWILANNPVVYYRFDETSGTAIADASPNNNDGVASGGLTLNQTGPLSGMKAVSFDGVDDKIHCSSNVEVAVTRWMYMFWIKTADDGTSSRAAIVHTADDTLDSSSALGMMLGEHGAFGSATPGNLAFGDNSHNLFGGRHTGSNRVDDSSWHLVNGIWIGGDVGGADPSDYAHYKIHIDGTQADVGDINEGVNTSCHGTPKTGTALNLGFNPLSNEFTQFEMAGFAAFDQETLVTGETCILLPTDGALGLDAPGIVTVTPMAQMPARVYYVKNLSAGNVVVIPDGSETIDGQSTWTLGPEEAIQIAPYVPNSDWWVL